MNDILYYCHHIGNKYFVTGSHKHCKTEQMGIVDSDYSSLRSDHSATNSEVGSIVSNTSGSVVSNTSLSSSFFSQRKHYILLTLMFKDKRVMLDELTMQYNLPYIRNIFFSFYTTLFLIPSGVLEDPKNMINFEALRLVISSSLNYLLLKS